LLIIRRRLKSGIKFCFSTLSIASAYGDLSLRLNCRHLLEDVDFICFDRLGISKIHTPYTAWGMGTWSFDQFSLKPHSHSLLGFGIFTHINIFFLERESNILFSCATTAKSILNNTDFHDLEMWPITVQFVIQYNQEEIIALLWLWNLRETHSKRILMSERFVSFHMD